MAPVTLTDREIGTGSDAIGIQKGLAMFFQTTGTVHDNYMDGKSQVTTRFQIRLICVRQVLHRS